jgi:hypothetical protein
VISYGFNRSAADHLLVSDVTQRALMLSRYISDSVTKTRPLRSASSIMRGEIAKPGSSCFTLSNFHVIQHQRVQHATRRALILQCKNLQTCNAKASSRMRLCAARRSHLNRAKFIPQLSVNRRNNRFTDSGNHVGSVLSEGK